MAMSIMLRNASKVQVPLNVAKFGSIGGRANILTNSLHKFQTVTSTALLLNRFPNSPVYNVTPCCRMSTSDHSKLWKAERALAVAMLGILPIGIAFPCQPLDQLMAVSIIMHQYWGLEAITTDYVRSVWFGNTVPKVVHLFLILLSIVTLGGLFTFNYNDIGISNAIRRLWQIKGASVPPSAED